jgi:hypothetical protein
MKKGITLLTVLLLPITIYLIFAISTIHYVAVPHYGPILGTKAVEGKSKPDTLYHHIGSFSYRSSRGLRTSAMLRGHMYVAALIAADSVKNKYNCSALKAYYTVNKGELDTLHFAFFFRLPKDSVNPAPDFSDTLGIKRDHCLTFYPDDNDLTFLIHENYFKPRPSDKKTPWLSTRDLVLVDAKGCVRGYYDGRYAPEIGRMVEDIKHIKFHDEAEGMEKKYTPVKKKTP